MNRRHPDAWLTILPPLPPGAYVARGRRDLPFPLADPSYRLFAMARQALWQGVRALGLQEGEEILVPALHHGSEVEALVRTGLAPRFYDVGPDLAPAEDELESLITSRTRALYLIHTLGIPQDAPRWRRWCDERGLLLFEDAAMAWLSDWDGRPIGSFGDLAIFCLYKTVPVPDGGALVGPATAARPESRRRPGAARLLRRHASWLAQRSRPLARRMSEGYDPVYRPTDARIELGDPGSPASAGTALLLPRLADAAVAERRRDHYRRMLDALGDRVPEGFRELPAGASPFGFAIEADDTTACVRHFADFGVHGTHLWPIGHPLLAQGEHPRADALRVRTVTLPVHQGLREADVERVIEVARQYSA